LVVGIAALAGAALEGATAVWPGLGLTGVDWAKPEGALKMEELFALKIEEVFVLGAATTGVKAE
jgi:hypothetical protein